MILTQITLPFRQYSRANVCLPFRLMFLPNSLLSSSRDSTYRDEDSGKTGEGDQNTNGIIPITKSSSCSSFLIDKLFRGISISGS